MLSEATKEARRREAINNEMRPKFRQFLLDGYCNEDGMVIKKLPNDVYKQARRLRLLKACDFGRPDPLGFKSWWFVRLEHKKGYLPPNYEHYKNGTKLDELLGEV